MRRARAGLALSPRVRRTSGIAQRARLPRWHAANRVTASAVAAIAGGARLAFITACHGDLLAQFMHTRKVS